VEVGEREEVEGEVEEGVKEGGKEEMQIVLDFR
jgi:hypothetical protein